MDFCGQNIAKYRSRQLLFQTQSWSIFHDQIQHMSMLNWSTPLNKLEILNLLIIEYNTAQYLIVKHLLV